MLHTRSLTCLPILVIAGGLIALAWQQWQSDSDRPFFSQGWVKEETALRILSDTGTEASSGLLVQIAFHLQQAQEFYRRAVLRRPLCVDCQHHLARVAVLLELLYSPYPDPLPDGVSESDTRGEGNRGEGTTMILAGFQRSLALAPARADLWENISRFFLQLWPALSKTERRFAITCLEQALTLAPERTEAILATAFPVDPDLPAALSGSDPRRGFAAVRLYQQRGNTGRARRQAQKIVARLQEEELGVRREGVRREEAFSSFLLLAEVQLFLGNKEEAREAYEQGLEQTTDPAVHKDFCWRLAAWHFERIFQLKNDGFGVIAQ